METIIQYAQTHPIPAGVIAAVVLAVLYLLLNRKSAAAKDAERRIAQMANETRSRYHGQRPID